MTGGSGQIQVVQLIRGPYPIKDGVAADSQHLTQHQKPLPAPA